MNKLFYDLIEKKIINFDLEKENMNSLSQKEIDLFIEDIFWRYDPNKICFKIPSLHKENNQKIINLVVEKPYYLKCLLEDIETFPQKKIDTDINLSLVEKLNVNNKEVFLKVLNKITCFNFFLLNYNKFIYNEEEKNLIKELFSILKIDTIKKKILSKKEKESIYNKTGLIEPLLKATEINGNLKEDSFLFFIDNYKYNPNYELTKLLFLNKIDYILNNFKKDSYELFIKNNMSYIIEYPEKIKKDIEMCKSCRGMEKIIISLEYFEKLTGEIMLKYEIENF